MASRTTEIILTGNSTRAIAALNEVGLASSRNAKVMGDTFTAGTTKVGGVFSKLGGQLGQFGLPFTGALGVMGTKMDEAGKKSSSLGSTLSRVGSIEALAAGAGLLAFGSIAVKTALEGEAAHSRLEVSIKNAGGAYRDYSGRIDETAQHLAKFGFTNDDVQSSIAALIPATHNIGTAIQTEGLAADLARFKNISLGDATKTLVAIEAGRLKGLAALGVSSKDAAGKTITVTEAIRRLSDVTRGAAAKDADTFAGKLRALGAEGHNLAETVGNALIPKIEGLASATIAGISGFESANRATDGWLGKIALVATALPVGVFAVDKLRSGVVALSGAFDRTFGSISESATALDAAATGANAYGTSTADAATAANTLATSADAAATAASKGAVATESAATATAANAAAQGENSVAFSASAAAATELIVAEQGAKIAAEEEAAAQFGLADAQAAVAKIQYQIAAGAGADAETQTALAAAVDRVTIAETEQAAAAKTAAGAQAEFAAASDSAAAGSGAAGAAGGAGIAGIAATAGTALLAVVALAGGLKVAGDQWHDFFGSGNKLADELKGKLLSTAQLTTEQAAEFSSLTGVNSAAVLKYRDDLLQGKSAQDAFADAVRLTRGPLEAQHLGQITGDVQNYVSALGPAARAQALLAEAQQKFNDDLASGHATKAQLTTDYNAVAAASGVVASAQGQVADATNNGAAAAKAADVAAKSLQKDLDALGAAAGGDAEKIVTALHLPGAAVKGLTKDITDFDKAFGSGFDKAADVLGQFANKANVSFGDYVKAQYKALAAGQNFAANIGTLAKAHLDTQFLIKLAADPANAGVVQSIVDNIGKGSIGIENALEGQKNSVKLNTDQIVALVKVGAVQQTSDQTTVTKSITAVSSAYDAYDKALAVHTTTLDEGKAKAAAIDKTENDLKGTISAVGDAAYTAAIHQEQLNQKIAGVRDPAKQAQVGLNAEKSALHDLEKQFPNLRPVIEGFIATLGKIPKKPITIDVGAIVTDQKILAASTTDLGKKYDAYTTLLTRVAVSQGTDRHSAEALTGVQRALGQGIATTAEAARRQGADQEALKEQLVGTHDASLIAKAGHDAENRALQQLENQFPGLRGQIDAYIKKLNAIPPSKRTTVSSTFNETHNVQWGINFNVTANGQNVPPGLAIGVIQSSPGVAAAVHGKPQAEGGPVEKGKLYTVGEKGDELFVPQGAAMPDKATGRLPAPPAIHGRGPADKTKPSIVGAKGPELFVPEVKGTIVPHGKFKARETGGPVERHKPYLVGEKGTEWFVPDTLGKVPAKDAPGRHQPVDLHAAAGVPVKLTLTPPRETKTDKTKPTLIGKHGPELFVPDVSGTILPHGKSLEQREFGGPVTAGKPYLVGEKRPEWFVPTAARQMGGGQTTVVNNHYTLNASSMDPRQSSQLILEGLRELERRFGYVPVNTAGGR